MRKNTYLLLAIMSIMFSTAFGTELTGDAANRKVAGAEKVKTGTSSNIPEYVKFREASAPAFNQFNSWINSHYRLPAGSGFKLLNTETDRLGFTHYRYQQTINGVPVEGTMYLLHVKNNNIISMNGVLFDKISAAANPSIDKASALSKAINYTNASLYRWQVAYWEEQLKQTNNDPSATWYPKGELFYAPLNGIFKATEYRLCYRFDIYAEKPISRKYVFVDALTGAIIYTKNRIHETNSTATVVTAYSGTHTITTDSVNPTTFRLRETGRGLGIETYNSGGTTNHPQTDFTDTDNLWDNVNASLDQYAGDAHWGAEMTYDFYFTKFSRNSLDNAGQKLLSYVHYDQGLVNANWDGTHMNYGDGDGTTYTPLTSLDVTGHEISHGITENTSNLNYADESGGLNEAFSDCMGNAIRYFGKQSATIDWLIGDEIGGTPFRNMANPNQYDNPDCYGGLYWNAPNEVHNNSGVMNFWFYLLTEGGSGTNDLGNTYSVAGLGIDYAAAICYRMNAIYLTPTSEYADARYYSIQAATDLYGACSPEYASTVNAWYAVGVGTAYSAGMISDFTSSVTSQCQVPASVPFINTSNNGGSFTWDFGDGTTSTAVNPVHVYTAFGTYNVKLVADGGACGIDSVTKNAFISIDAANPCIVILNGVTATQTSCVGQLFDDGGPTGDYADNSVNSVIIAPIGAATVQLTFSAFDLENTYDFLYIYDGATTNSPQLGSFTGNTVPGTVTSTGGVVLIRMVTDPFVVGAGFALNWQCVLSTIPPVANFTTDVTSSCNGLVNFTDLSINGPTSWLWDFGDGNTSTLQHPSYTYQTNGTFTVTLTASNGFGNNTMVQTALVTINLPAAPTASAATPSVCAGSQATLNATGTDSLTWFDLPVGGNAVYTGGVFTTPALYTATTYYVESDIYPAVQNNGPADNTFGGGGIFNFNLYRAMIFDCYSPTTLVSVKVYAQGAGIRTIVLRDNAGTTLESLDANLPDGMSIVTLNFDLPVGTDLELGCTDNNVDLYRNTDGVTFPYTLAGVVSITGNNGNPDYYYFFYDWVLQGAPCTSARTPVSVAVDPTPFSWFTVNWLTNVVVFTDASVGATTWAWDFGDGGTSTLQNPTHTYATTGNYTVTLTTTAGGTCSNSITYTVIITATGIDNPTAADVFSMYPNPARSEVVIKLADALQKSDCTIKLTNAIGQTVLAKDCKAQLATYTLDVSQLPVGVYTVQIENAEHKYYQKLTKQ